MGIHHQRSPDATLLLNEGDVVEVEYSAGSPVHPGHSPASIWLL